MGKLIWGDDTGSSDRRDGLMRMPCSDRPSLNCRIRVYGKKLKWRMQWGLNLREVFVESTKHNECYLISYLAHRLSMFTFSSNVSDICQLAPTRISASILSKPLLQILRCDQFPSWVVLDEQLREQLRIAVSRLLLPAYRNFVGRLQSNPEFGRNADRVIKYGPEECG